MNTSCFKEHYQAGMSSNTRTVPRSGVAYAETYLTPHNTINAYFHIIYINVQSFYVLFFGTCLFHL